MPTLTRHYPGFVDEPDEGPEEALVRTGAEALAVPWVHHWQLMNNHELAFCSWHREIVDNRPLHEGPRRGLLIARCYDASRRKMFDHLIAIIDDISILWDVAWARRYGEVFAASPTQALDQLLVEGDGHLLGSKLINCALAGTDGQTYSSYRNITRSSLKDRSYRIDFIDGAPSIFWTDVRHNPRTYKQEPL